jgi:hypothetical protein
VLFSPPKTLDARVLPFRIGLGVEMPPRYGINMTLGTSTQLRCGIFEAIKP